MILAISDYRRYVRLSGRYSRNYRNFMGGAFQGCVPADKVEKLQPGDCLFIQTLGSPISWLIMYLTSSEVSHFALYIGGGNIVHATTDAGVVVEPIRSVFHENSRVLFVQRNISQSERDYLISNYKNMVGAPYGWVSVYLKAYQIISARDWRSFRWKFFADISLILLVIDTPLVLALHYPVVSWSIPVYLAIIGFHALLWRMFPLSRSALTVKPNDMIETLLSSGGVLIYDEDFISKQIRDEISMLRGFAHRRSSQQKKH